MPEYPVIGQVASSIAPQQRPPKVAELMLVLAHFTEMRTDQLCHDTPGLGEISTVSRTLLVDKCNFNPGTRLLR